MMTESPLNWQPNRFCFYTEFGTWQVKYI